MQKPQRSEVSAHIKMSNEVTKDRKYNNYDCTHIGCMLYFYQNALIHKSSEALRFKALNRKREEIS